MHVGMRAEIDSAISPRCLVTLGKPFDRISRPEMKPSTDRVLSVLNGAVSIHRWLLFPIPASICKITCACNLPHLHVIP